MCIIAYKPAGQNIDRQTLQTCFENNPDGAGFMFPCEGKVLIRKGYFTFAEFWATWEKTAKIYGDTVPVVFHFRIATAGKVDKTNCHPHRIKQDLAFVHNGILSCVKVSKKSRISDTIIYRDFYLRDLTAKSLRESALFLLMGEHIGTYNKFVFLNGRGEVAFANEKSGIWHGGIWYSNNTYRPKFVYLPKGKPGAGQAGQAAQEANWWDDYKYCEYCGKDLDTPDEREEGLCFACADYAGYGYDECGGCDCVLADAAHRLAGWCDDCGKEVYGGAEWEIKLDECTAEAAVMEDVNDRQYL